MALVCYNKPNRKKARHFTVRDVARIAKYAVADGADALLVVKEVINALGLAGRFCELAILAASMIKLRRMLLEAGAAWGVKKFLQLLLRFLGYLKNPFVRWTTRLNIGAAIVIAAILYLEKVIKVFADLLERLPSIADATELAGDLCNEAADIITSED